MDIYLLRHGETAYNAEKRYLSRSDVSLSAKGLAELIPAGFLRKRSMYPLCAGHGRLLECSSQLPG